MPRAYFIKAACILKLPLPSKWSSNKAATPLAGACHRQCQPSSLKGIVPAHRTCLQVAVTEEAIIRSLVSFRMVYLSCRKPSYPDWVVFSTRMPLTPAQQTLHVRADKRDSGVEAASGPNLVGPSAPKWVGDRDASLNVFATCRHAAAQHACHIWTSIVQVWRWRGYNSD